MNNCSFFATKLKMCLTELTKRLFAPRKESLCFVAYLFPNHNHNLFALVDVIGNMAPVAGGGVDGVEGVDVV